MSSSEPAGAASRFVGAGVARRAAFNDRRRSEFAEEQRAAAELGDGAVDPSEVVEVAAADVDVPLAMPHYNSFRPEKLNCFITEATPHTTI